jgi:glycosyltransferase involved in cell wall biosynthesis
MPKTVLNVSQNYFVRGGSDRYFFVLGELLERHGQRVIPFSSRQARNEPTPWSRYFPPGVDFDSPGPLDLARYIYSRSAARCLRRLLTDEPIDLAHLHIYYGQLTGAILPVLREAGIPVVQTVHDFKLVCPVYSLMSHGAICEACQGHRFWQATARRCNRGSVARSALSTVESYVSRWLGNVDAVDHFISVSEFQRHKLIELGVPGEKITTVHNFGDTASIRPETKPGDYLLYFGRIERLKGVLTLVDAAKLVPQVRVLLVGRGEATAEIERRIADEQITNVELLGFQSGAALEELIRGSIATIVPSEGYDNCPMAILESYSYARPVIGARIGGIPELIDHDADGFVFAPGDAETLARHLDWFHAHRAEAVEMGLSGRRRVERDFNAETHFAQLRNVYAKVGVKLPPQAPTSAPLVLDLPISEPLSVAT